MSAGISAGTAALIGGGMSLASGILGSNAAQSAANTQAGAANAASQASLQATQETNAQQLAMYNQNVARQQPWVTQGQTAATQLSGLMAPGGQLTQNFTPSQLNMSPAYQFQLQQGEQQLQAGAAARGLLGSGQNEKDINDYAQQSASTAYQNAFNNYNTNQTNLYNRLSNLSSLGQNAAAGVGNNGAQVANSMSNNTMAGTAAANNYLTGAAAAGAAGQVGSANAISSAMGVGANTYMGIQNMNNVQSYLQGLNGGSVPAATPYNTVNMSGFSGNQVSPFASAPNTGLGTGLYQLPE